MPVRFAVVVGTSFLLAALSGCSGATGSAESDIRDAKTEWTQPAAAEVSSMARSGDIAVAAGSDKYLEAFSMRSGKQLWKSDTDGDSPEDVWVTKDAVVAKLDDAVLVLDLKSGDERFKHKVTDPDSGYELTATNSVMVLSEFRDGSSSSQVMAFSLKDEEEVWSEDYDDTMARPLLSAAEERPQFSHSGASKSIHRATDAKVIQVGNPDASIPMAALDASSGKEEWALDNASAATMNSLVTQEDERLVFWLSKDARCEQKMATVDVTSGNTTEFATTIERHSNSQGWSCHEKNPYRPHVGEGSVFVQNSQHRPQLEDVVTGEPRWKAKETGQPLLYASGIAVYSTAKSDAFVAVDIETGKKLWKASAAELGVEAGESDGFDTNGRQLLTHKNDGDGFESRAIDLRSGEALWQHNAKPLAFDKDRYVFALGDMVSSVGTAGK